MAELKTKSNDANVDAFIASVTDEQRRSDCRAVVNLMSRLSGAAATMWGSNIIGFGSYHYTYASGREGDWFLTGVAPRKQNLTLYIMSGFDEYQNLMDRLGKYKTGKSCLYLKRLEDVDPAVLEQLIGQSIAFLADKYG